MFSRSLIPAIRNLELAMGHTHQCMQCRSTFLAHEDGCPYCGTGATARLLSKLQKPHSGKYDEDNIWYWMIINDSTGNAEYVFFDDSCQWPRQS